jgi:pantoate--beta-alanine ligase
MKPLFVTDITPLRNAIAEARRRGLTISLVPTMGALHAGHLSLIETARAETGYVVVSIFVNPTQIGPKEDLGRYPRPLERDLELCEQAGVDLVFHPEPAVMYPADYRTFVEVTGLQAACAGRRGRDISAAWPPSSSSCSTSSSPTALTSARRTLSRPASSGKWWRT